MKKNRKGNSKIDEQINKSLYNYIIHHPQVMQSPIFNDCLKVNIDGHTIHHPQVMQSPIFNDCLKVKIDGHTEPQIIPNILL